MPDWNKMIKKDRIKAVRAMAMEGYSFRHAALELKTTRNAIAGLATREGIKFTGKPGPKPETDLDLDKALREEPAPQAKPAKPRKPRRKTVKPVAPAPVVEETAPVELEPVLETASEGPTYVPSLGQMLAAQTAPPNNDNTPGKILLIDRERWQCAYPLWDDFPGVDKAFCCGQRVREGVSYCPEHAEKLLVPPKTKRLSPFAR
jgi:hypothetical protein